MYFENLRTLKTLITNTTLLMQNYKEQIDQLTSQINLLSIAPYMLYLPSCRELHQTLAIRKVVYHNLQKELQHYKNEMQYYIS